MDLQTSYDSKMAVTQHGREIEQAIHSMVGLRWFAVIGRGGFHGARPCAPPFGQLLRRCAKLILSIL
jgi:hypothetical protein